MLCLEDKYSDSWLYKIFLLNVKPVEMRELSAYKSFMHTYATGTYIDV